MLSSSFSFRLFSYCILSFREHYLALISRPVPQRRDPVLSPLFAPANCGKSLEPTFWGEFHRGRHTGCSLKEAVIFCYPSRRLYMPRRTNGLSEGRCYPGVVVNILWAWWCARSNTTLFVCAKYFEYVLRARDTDLKITKCYSIREQVL